MDLKTFLENNTIINKADLARQMWPDVPEKKINTIKVKLANKLAERAGQRITDNDKKLVKEVLGDLANKIMDFVKQY